MNKRYFLEPGDKILHFENNLVTLVLSSGEAYEGLEPKRLFPVNSPNEYITLLPASGKEIGVIRSIDDLDPASRAVILQSLHDYYFIPEITEITGSTIKGGVKTFVTQTNRGPKIIEVRDRNHDIRAFKDGSVRIRDADDNRYVIPDYKKLSKQSLKHIIADI